MLNSSTSNNPPRPARKAPAPAGPAAAPKYMLDTNTCVYIAEGKPNEWGRAADQYARCRPGEVVMSAVTLAELRQGVGAAKDDKTRRIRARALAALLRRIPVLPFDSAAADCCEQLAPFVRGRERENDKLIAAHAFRLGLTLVTNNLRHFQRYPELRLDNWV